MSDHKIDRESYARWRHRQDDRVALMYEVLGVIDKIDVRLREIYERRELGQSWREIGKVMQMHPCTARYKYLRAKKLIKSILKGRQ